MSAEESLKAEAEQYVPTGYDPELYKLRHSTAHIMAQAVLENFPEAKVAIGPPIDNGFYYDFRPAAGSERRGTCRHRGPDEGAHPETARLSGT